MRSISLDVSPYPGLDLFTAQLQINQYWWWGNQDGPPSTGIRSLVGMGSPATTGRPFRRERNGTVAKTCRVIPRHRVMNSCRLRMAFPKKKSLGHQPRTYRKLCNLVEKSQGSRPSTAKCLVAHRDDSACTRAGAAVLVPFKRVLPP